MMYSFLQNNSIKLIISSILIIVGSIYMQNWYFKNNNLDSNISGVQLLLTEEDLSHFNGVRNKKLYLGILGSVFDVSSGKRHYMEGSSYHYFVGKDGTRSLVTGNFKDESEEKYHVLDLKCDDIFAIINWRKTFREKYLYVGMVKGRYYASDGTETEYMKKFKIKLKECKEEKEKLQKQNQSYPPCNVAWSEADGTRVWCSKSSGGIQRSWIGVPRQLYTPGDKKPKCVCIKEDTNMLKPYHGCLSTSTECYINVD
ncbi:neuferricin [Pieris rapae]|uniref:neuferricin n=1 Tax=Pieris rapae TaxID=64459 RepID=UPI001E280F41|nr:neuferricin [Pieris rapae]